MSAASSADSPVSETVRHHVLSVLVENRAGVLSRVANLFARRGYNIFSLAVAPTEDEAFSRITVVVDVESSPLEQIVKQLDKLINVVAISELDPRSSVERELLLATVSAPTATRDQVAALIEASDARLIAAADDQLTLSFEAHPDEVDDFEESLRPFGIVEVQRTGRVALPRLGSTTASA